jgi:ATP-dependent Clp protease protease subunit
MTKKRKKDKQLDVSLGYWFESGVFLKNRIIYVEGEYLRDDFNELSLATFGRFFKAITALEADGDVPINIVLNTIGGDVDCGYAMYDRIRQSPCPIQIIGYGAVMSMGAVVLQAADERVLSPNTTMMLHEGIMSSGDVQPKTFKAWGEQAVKEIDRMALILHSRMVNKLPKLTLKEVKDKFHDDWILSAPEAVEMGLADRILEFRKLIK